MGQLISKPFEAKSKPPRISEDAKPEDAQPEIAEISSLVVPDLESSDTPFGSEIFRAKNALWNVPINSDIQKTCGNCFSNSASTVSKAGRFCTREQDRPKLLACGRCKIARYRSKVRSVIVPVQF